MAEQNYGEIICEAVDIVAKELLKTVQFDQTVIGTIVDDSTKADGKYRVSYNATTFDAYSTNTNLAKGNNVYVQIPNGDWSEQKLILSKKVDKNSEDRVVYNDPFDSFVDITNNLIDKDLGQKSLLANGDTKEKLIWEINEVNYAKYTRLGIKASFRAWLHEYNTVKGNYGLRLTLTGKADNGATNEISKVCIFDCQNMLGNPYNFESYYDQKQLYVIENINNIISMRLEFFQDGDFINNLGEKIPHEDLPPNIFVKDIIVSLGHDSSEFEDNTLILYTLDDSSYVATADPITKNNKKIQVRWIHKFENDKIKVVDDKETLSYQLLWYRKRIGIRSDNEYSGVDWERFASQTQTVDENNQIICTYEGDIPAYNQVIFKPDATLQNEYVKAIIMYNNLPIYSNVIEFNNAKIVPNKTTEQVLTALSIKCEDNSFGNYFLYNLGGQIVDQADSQTEREFSLCFNPTPGEAYLTEAEEIEWTIPKAGTMIVLDEAFTSETDDYYYIKHTDLKGKNDISAERTLKYKIRNHYHQSYNNNTISCKIIKDTLVYSTHKELTFGPIGTAGTDYTFVLDFEDRATALTIGDSNAVIVNAKLYDNKGQEITTIEGKEIDWQLLYNSNNRISFTRIQNKTASIELKLANTVGVIPTDNYVVLQATLKSWGDYDLQAYLPIPIRLNTNYYISGPTAVCYNSLGTLDDISFFQNPYRIFEYNKEPVYGAWTLTSSGMYTPKLFVDNDGRSILMPLSFYTEEDEMKQVCVVGYKDNKAVWSQPIFITQNKYPSSLINNWNGELKIDDENNAIMAAKVVAGKKNKDDNTFSGVMMGDWSGEEVVYELITDPDDPTKQIKKPKTNNGATETAIANHTGIYGFYHGTASFGFRDDGTAFIGTPGAGRLEFNGKSSTIQSNLFAEGRGGMSLDFDDGLIEIKNPIKIPKDDETSYEINELFIKLDVADPTTPFTIGQGYNSKFKVDWDGTIHAINGYFTGHIEANSGRIGAWNLTDYDASENAGALYSNGCLFDENGKLLQGTYLDANGAIHIGQYFSVDNIGYLKATNVDLTGAITAESGQIGAWVIDPVFKDEDGNIISGGSLHTNNTWFNLDGSISAGDNFSVSKEGKLWANSGDFTGIITSTEGEIGGWTIGTNILAGGSTNSLTGKRAVELNSSDGSITGASIYSGSLNSNSTTGYIALNGYLTVNNDFGKLGYITSGWADGTTIPGIGMSYSNAEVKATETNAGLRFTENAYITAQYDSENTSYALLMGSKPTQIQMLDTAINIKGSTGNVNITGSSINIGNINNPSATVFDLRGVDKNNQKGIYARFA